MVEKAYWAILRSGSNLAGWSRPRIRRFIRFIALPYCFVRLVNWDECTVGPLRVASDLLFIFFRLKSFPDFYSPYRLWEKPRQAWFEYYGSSYDAYQRSRMERNVQPPEYRILFDDKEVCHSLCSSVGLPVPELLGIVRNQSDLNGLVSEALLKAPEGIVLKPALGRAGMGVAVVIKENDDLVAKQKGERVPVQELSVTEKLLVQQLLVQHPEMATFCASSLNTVRMTTLLTAEGDVLFLGASARFGREGAVVDNWSAGGVAVGVDPESGTLLSPAFDKNGKVYDLHPSAGISFQGFQVPFWEEALALAELVQRTFPYYRLIGSDLAFGLTGPILLEINSQPDLVFQEQTSGPILANKRILDAFGAEDLLIFER